MIRFVWVFEPDALTSATHAEVTLGWQHVTTVDTSGAGNPAFGGGDFHVYSAYEYNDSVEGKVELFPVGERRDCKCP